MADSGLFVIGKDIFLLIISYLIGCFNTGYYYMKLFYHEDIRNLGTKVTGARNVSRFAGKAGFIITFLGDCAKGALVVLLCRLFQCDDTITLAGILLVIAGHIFPFQLNYRGGKGLSTAVGAFLVYQPLLILAWLFLFIIMLIFIRRATAVCALSLSALVLVLVLTGSSWMTIVFFLLYALIINYACRLNIKEYLEE